MKKDKKVMLARGSLFMALVLIFQGIRLFIPVPPFVGMFLIGSLVNMTLILAVRYTGIGVAATIACALPIVAFLQGQLPLIILVPLVAIGNMVLVLLINIWWASALRWIAPIAKAVVLYVGTLIVLGILGIDQKIAAMVLVMMSWPQLFTGILGVILALYIQGKIRFLK